MEELIERIRNENFVFLDIEYIQSTSSHQCIRKYYMLSKDGSYECEDEFYACRRFHQLKSKYKSAFIFCRENIHLLDYEPSYFAPRCRIAPFKIKNILEDREIDFVLYKGGTIERDLCTRIGVQSYNIELLIGVEKVQSHDPREEVQFYMKQIWRICNT